MCSLISVLRYQSLIVLLVVLLYVGGDLLGVSLLERLNSLIVLLELVKLLSILGNSSVEASLQLINLAFKICHLLLLLRFQRLLLGKQAFFVLFELL